MVTETSLTTETTKRSYEVYQADDACLETEEPSNNSNAEEAPEAILDNGAFYALTLDALQTGMEDPALIAKTMKHIDAIYPRTIEDLPPALLFIETAATEPTKPSDFCIRNLIGRLGVDVEALKYSEMEKLIAEKEKATEQIKQIHEFLNVLNKHTNLKNGECNLSERKEEINKIRALLGEDLLPTDVCSWNKEQLEALRGGLFNWIQDKTTEITLKDLYLSHIFEELKQLLDSLLKIGRMEEESTNKIIHNSRTGA